MRGGARYCKVSPHVAVPWEIRRLVEERVMHNRQAGIVHGREDRAQRRVVDRQPFGKDHDHSGYPRLVSARLQGAERPFDVLPGNEQTALQSVWIDAAVVVEIA